MNVFHGTKPVRWWTVDGEALASLGVIPGKFWGGWEVKYENDLERSKRTTRDVAGPWLPIYDDPPCRPVLDGFFADDSELWGRVTGITGLTHDETLHGGGLQVMEPGGYLSPHLDCDFHPVQPAKRRALSLVKFLNPTWEKEWGGALVLCDPNGNMVTRIVPTPGTTVAFETTDLAFHGVEPITGPMERVTAAKSFWTWAGRTRSLFLPNREPR